ncbi:MAG: HupE/UreJ family protein [Gammaproteobacteria bacterium]|nr:HupE/UreJ family protein [Gammaproteobacteria bacterium]
MTIRKPILAILLLIALPSIGWAHKPSDSYLNIMLTPDAVAVRWDIALRDLEYALGLDKDGDGTITWGELRARQQAIAAYALAHLNADTAGTACAPQAERHAVENHGDGAYAVLFFDWNCPHPTAPLNLDYRLFFDLDPLHRGLVQARVNGETQTAVLSPENPRLTVQPGGLGVWRQFAQYWREGVWHIGLGFDHLLFLLTLLLPAVLYRDGDGWRPAPDLRTVSLAVAGIVTAFTVAHSITLSAAVLGWISLPSRLVESAIAITVLLAALNNLYPLVRTRRWLLAFGLGLIHGFGFAGVLAELGLPSRTLGLALAGFNLGVECGQLAVVALLLPLAFALRGSWFYRRGALQLGSLSVAAIASFWFLERI